MRSGPQVSEEMPLSNVDSSGTETLAMPGTDPVIDDETGSAQGHV